MKTNGANKQSLCVGARLHISAAQKETLTFIIATATRFHFPRCHGEKIRFFFLSGTEATCYTKDAPRVFVSVSVCVFNWISLKVQINLEGGSVSSRGLTPRFQPPSFSETLIRSLHVSSGCYSSCLDLFLIESCFTNRKCCCRVTGRRSSPLRFSSAHCEV